MSVRVVTDSASDLPSEIAEELGVTIVPVYVNFGTNVFRDGVDLTTDGFFDKLLDGSVFPTTSQPSPGDFKEAYSRVASDGADGIVSVHISSRVSGTVNSANQGAQQTDTSCPIRVVDTLQASMATGLVAIAAAQAAQAGASINEVVAIAESATRRSQCIALLDTLEYLVKGGRVGKARGALGNLLRIKPMIILREGEVHELAKERTYKRAVARLIRTAEEFAPAAAAAVMYSTNREPAEQLAQSISHLLVHGSDPIVIGRMGPALGTHAGPGALGIGILETER